MGGKGSRKGSGKGKGKSRVAKGGSKGKVRPRRPVRAARAPRLQNSQSGAFSSELEGELGTTRIPGFLEVRIRGY
eukprot:symbB.v1.2.001151.t1/scaffold47.1/size388503/6